MRILRPNATLVEPSRRVEFSASVSPSGATLQWSSPQIDPCNRTYFSTPCDALWLVARPGSLEPGAHYTFLLTATDALLRHDQDSITIETNRPPENGTFVICARRGVALSSVLQYSAPGWTHSTDQHLTYSFSIVSSTGRVVIIGKGPVSFANSTLRTGMNRTITATITDSLGGSAVVAADPVTASLEDDDSKRWLVKARGGL